MKEIMATVFFALAILTASAANDPAKINEQATGIARSLADQLGLNELEYIQVKKFTAEKLTREAEIKDMYRNDRSMMARKMAELDTDYKHRIQCLFNSRQFEAYAALHHHVSTSLTNISPDNQ